MELRVNRAMTTTRREAGIGKISRNQVQGVSMLPELQRVSASRMKAVVGHLRDLWDLGRPAKRTKRHRGAAAGAQQQASSPATYSAQPTSFLRHIAEQKHSGSGELVEAAHMQPAAMELLTGLQHALGSTGLVLADTHDSNHLHSPVRKIVCSGLAASSRLWSQLVVPFEFKLHTGEADAALGQLTETADIVRRQQPERRFLCGVSMTLDTVEVFRFEYGPLGSFSRIHSTGVQPLELRPDSAGLGLLASIVAAPLPLLGFVPVPLPHGQLGAYSFTCTDRLAISSEPGTQGARQNSRVYQAELDANRRAVLKQSKDPNEADILARLPHNSRHLVRLLAAGSYRFSGDAWEAVLVAPVVEPLEAGLPVQQVAQVTSDVADAVEQLTKLNIVHRDISPNNIGILGGRGWLFDFGAAQVVKSWSEPPSHVSAMTGTPMYMAIQVLQGENHTPNTALESLLYSILSVCSGGHLSDCGADFVDDPAGAAMQRLGYMIQPTLGALQHVPHDKRDFVATLHNVFFPKVKKQPLRSHCTDVLPAHVKAACSKFLKK